MSPGTFALAFLPVLVVVGWILVANQPGNGWQEGRLDSWSNSIGILGVVHSIGLWHGVLAFAFGLMLGLSLDGVPAPVEEAAPAYAGPAGAAARTRRRTSRSRPSAAGRRERRRPAGDRAHRGHDPDADPDPDTGRLNPAEPLRGRRHSFSSNE